jgi:hypothetical protein
MKSLYVHNFEMTINRGILLMHLLLKLWNGFVVQHIDNMILTWNIMFRKYINISYNKINEIPLFIVISYQQIKEMIYTRVQMKTLHRESTYKDFIQKNEMFLPYVIRKSSIVLVHISYNKMIYDFHGYIAVLPPIFFVFIIILST